MTPHVDRVLTDDPAVDRFFSVVSSLPTDVSRLEGLDTVRLGLLPVPTLLLPELSVLPFDLTVATESS